ncbi:hypothetical protein Goari_006539 [Gossypium aridum]|uniref:AT-hook motif nuclear-localized protein n=1 Tax=Gossypium aridum TaxID=34290 RepID=A0A7J8XNI4_GOSAI|nr:hypothetical protein [Gossypium aridum]
MDRRDTMALTGSASYYIQQRGIAGSGIHGSQDIHMLSSPNVQYQSSMSATTMGPVERITPHSVNVGTRSAVPSSETTKRKRGRPRKYGPDGTVSLALTPPSVTNPGTLTPPSQKRGRGRPPGTGKKQQLASLGVWLSGSAGMGFTPHVITVAIGEDIATKLMSFSQQGPRAVCILSANGAVSTVTLRQPSSLGGTVTYEV